MKDLKDELEKTTGIYGEPGIFSSWRVLKTKDGISAFIIVYIISFVLVILTHYPSFNNIPYVDINSNNLYLIGLGLSFFVQPFLQSLMYSAPLKNTFSNVKNILHFLFTILYKSL